MTCLLVLFFIPTKFYQNTQWDYQIYGAHKDASTYVTQQQKLSRKKAIIWPKFRGRLPISNLTCILQWYTLLQTSDKIKASIQNLLNGNQHLNPTIKPKSKMGHNSVKIWRMINNIEFDLYFTMIKTSADFEWNQCISSKVIERKRNVWRRRRRRLTTDPYVSAVLRRRR